MKQRIIATLAAIAILHAPLAHAQQSFDFTPGSTQVIETGRDMDINYAQDGWTFVSQGTQVTVTAPPQESSTLVTVPGIGDIQLNSTASATQDIQFQIGEAVTGQGDTHPPGGKTRTDTPQTRYFDLEATIEGQNVTGRLNTAQTLALAPYATLDRRSLVVTYSDADDTQIPLKSYHVDEKTLSATLTVQDGFTPANPSVLRVIDSSTGHVVLGATLTDLNYKQQTLDGLEVNAATLPKAEKISTGTSVRDLAAIEVQGIPVWVAAVGAVLFLLLIVVVGVLFSSRRKLKQLKNL